MFRVGRDWQGSLTFLAVLGVAVVGTAPSHALAQNDGHARTITIWEPSQPFTPPASAIEDKPLTLNLANALELANVRPLDIAVASERIRLAAAELEQASVLWLPTLYLGVDYFRHDGRIQDVSGNLFDTSKSSVLIGAGPSAVFAFSDAIFGPLAARQVARARDAELQTARNDSLLSVAEAYFNVQQARGELAAAQTIVQVSDELVRRTEKLSPGILPPVEAVRARAELSRRRQTISLARERWRTGSAELGRVLRLDAASLIEPLEPPQLRVTLVDLNHTVDDLIAVGLTNRPELANRQALVQATLQRLRTERIRSLVPSLLLRGAATNPAGTLAGGAFGGGRDEFVGNFAARGDFDVQLLWEIQNLGFGNAARVKKRRAEHELALLEFFRVQDHIAAEVAQAYAQARSAVERVSDAESELKEAADSVEKNFEGLGQTKRIGGNVILLVIRPQEVVAAVQALGQAYSDYYGTVADYNRSQFRLYHALGHPAQFVNGSVQQP